MLPPHTESKALRYTHIVQAILIIGLLGVGGARLAMGNPSGRPISRSDIIVITGSIKSLVFLAYMILTDYIPSLQRFASFRTNLILSVIELIFWWVIIGLTLSSLERGCVQGAGCVLTGLVILFTVILMSISVPVLYMSWRQRRHYKQTGRHPDENHAMNKV